MMKERLISLLEKECERQDKTWDEDIRIDVILNNEDREDFLENCSDYEEFHYWDFEKLDDNKWMLTITRN